LKQCIACWKDIPAKSSLCSQCGSYQRAWKNNLRYYSTIVGLVTFVVTALFYGGSLVPNIWKRFMWEDKIQILDVKVPGSMVIANVGDGDVFVRKLYWSGKLEESNFNETVFINKKVPVEQIVEAVELARKDLHKVPLARYMLDEEVPKQSRLKLLNEALSSTNACFDFRIALVKEVGMLASEATHKQSIWSIPLEGKVSFYSLHLNKTLEEKVSALGFVMKGEDAKCPK
jgi:hypothetical protein